MWSGLPVVTTATAGMKDVVSEGRTGLLVPPGDAGALAAAIGRLMNDADLRVRLGTEAHAVAHRDYTWENAAATLASAYDSARAGHG